jgi:hypothetical protein
MFSSRYDYHLNLFLRTEMNLFEIDMIQSWDLLDVSDQSLTITPLYYPLCYFVHQQRCPND